MIKKILLFLTLCFVPCLVYAGIVSLGSGTYAGYESSSHTVVERDAKGNLSSLSALPNSDGDAVDIPTPPPEESSCKNGFMFDFEDGSGPSCLCNDGYYLSGGECIICPVGHKCPVPSYSPDKCVGKEYQPEEGQASCLTCDATIETNSDGYQIGCVEGCGLGTYDIYDYNTGNITGCKECKNADGVITWNQSRYECRATNCKSGYNQDEFCCPLGSYDGGWGDGTCEACTVDPNMATWSTTKACAIATCKSGYALDESASPYPKCVEVESCGDGYVAASDEFVEGAICDTQIDGHIYLYIDSGTTDTLGIKCLECSNGYQDPFCQKGKKEVAFGKCEDCAVGERCHGCYVESNSKEEYWDGSKCVECVADYDCGNGQQCNNGVCEEAPETCPIGQEKDVNDNCVSCKEYAYCQGCADNNYGSYWDGYNCYECNSDSDCAGDNTYCENGYCHSCLGNYGTDYPYYKPGLGCVQCLSAADCPVSGEGYSPICLTNGMCDEVYDDTECESGYEWDGFSCVALDGSAGGCVEFCGFRPSDEEICESWGADPNCISSYCPDVCYNWVPGPDVYECWDECP